MDTKFVHEFNTSSGVGLQINSTPRIPIADFQKPNFLDYSISNFDVIKWLKILKIKQLYWSIK